MNFELTEETLEEGRVALHQLERQLNARNGGVNDNSSAASSKYQSTISDRKILDQVPRAARLNSRLESLGLTVEELEDRGLLEGGGAVPTYYTSMKQKGRRVMELQPRSHRLQERGKESLSKLLNSIMHMIRILVRRGLKLEEYCRLRDASKRGLIHKKEFYLTLKSLGLPFSSRELHDITNHYLVPSSEHVDYMTFLRDARVLRNGGSINYDGDTEGDKKLTSPIDSKLSMVIFTVKKMLSESLRGLSKDPDDVYRMFARWDTQGTGTVTATQFLRVLSKLHINLNEDDQDFLVELLDTNAMGRIDFESLLSYCFSNLDHENNHNVLVHDDFAVDTLSAVSTEGNNSVEQKSLPSLHRRPHTASISRPYNESNYLGYVGGGAVSGHNVGHSQQYNSYSGAQRSPVKSNQAVDRNGASGGRLQRPLTASGARVSSTPENFVSAGNSNKVSGTSKPTQQGQPQQQPPGQQQSLKHQRILSSIQRQQDYENQNFVKELPDDVINDDDLQEANNHGNQNAMEEYINNQDGGASYNDVTQLTEQEEYYQQRQISSGNNGNQRANSSNTLTAGGGGNGSGSNKDSEPSDHLVLLANQILTALREIIMTRYRRGKSLQEIFLHFDRESKAYFDSVDFVRATSDLRIEVSERVAAIALRMIALDGVTTVTFGEFKVFVLDSDHRLLELNVQEQLANLLEQEGREYKSWMVDVFWNEENGLNDSKMELSPQDKSNGMISKQAFVTGLQKIGLVLTASEVSRLVDRFDLQGVGMCSISRFVRMVQTSQAWHRAEKLLVYQDEAVEEAKILRQQLRLHGPRDGFPDLSEELIAISEYLGIRVLSEQHMLWIASDALKAPLPVSWTARKDKEGRTYFYNTLTNQARWEHPLDPHFRKLRDKYRQSEPEEQMAYERPSNTNGSMLHQMLPTGNNRPMVNTFSTPLPAATLQQSMTKPGLSAPPIDSKKKVNDGSHQELTYTPGERIQSAAPTRSGPLGKTDSHNYGGRNRPVSAPHNHHFSDHQIQQAFAAPPPLQRGNSSNKGLTASGTTGGGGGPSATDVSKAIVESIYSTPYLKSPQLPQTNKLFVDDKNTQLNEKLRQLTSDNAGFGLSSGFSHNNSGMQPAATRTRPSSSSKRSGNTLSAVERAVGYGKNIPHYLLPKGEYSEKQPIGNTSATDAKLKKLMEVNVIDRLDDILMQQYQSNKN